MTTQQGNTVLCGRCKCPAECVPDPEPHDKVTCPRCGRSDRLDHVTRIVGEHAAYLMQKHFSDGMAKANRGSKYIKVTVNKPAGGSYRWISDLKV